MISFGSQRGNGQELATHLGNEHDNEIVNFLYFENTVAEDVHGAFAEWDVQRRALTKAENYIYSLSVNPDPNQRPLTHEQMLDFVNRAEACLGLVGQPRVIVEHIKNDRLHWHAAWSRIDAENERAIQISFDREKLMVMTREFARDHGITLPDGYYKRFDKSQEKDKDYSLGEKYQFEVTGVTKEERSQIITELWRRRDTPAAFLKSLEHHGYVLTSGRCPYVLVDLYGKMNSLPKLIADSDVRTRQIREFLGTDRELPDVEQARAAAREFLKSLGQHKKQESRHDRIDMLNHQQADRRREVELKKADLALKQKTDRQAFAGKQRAERDQLRSEYFEEKQRIQQERDARKPEGLAGFLSRVSGMDVVRAKRHRHQDRQRLLAHQSDKQALKDQQFEQAEIFQRAQEMKALDVERERRSLDARDSREMQSLHKTFELEQNREIRKAYEHMPSVELQLSPPGRPTMMLRAKRRHTSEMAKEIVREKQAERDRPEEVRVQGDFSQVTGRARDIGPTEYERPNIPPPRNEKDTGRER